MTMSEDLTDYSEEFRIVEARLKDAAEARQEARRQIEGAVQNVHGRLTRTAAFELCEFTLKGNAISVVRGGNVIGVITSANGQEFDVSRPGAGKIAGPISASGVGETIAGLVLDNGSRLQKG